MGRLTFGETIYLLLLGECPSPGIGRLMEAILVSFIDHGATPPSTLAARNTATTGASLRACVAAGVLGFGRYHGGDIESCMEFLDAGLALVRRAVVVHRSGRADCRPMEGDGRRAARLRAPVPHAGSTRGTAVSDGARAGSRRDAHPDDPRGRDAAAHAAPARRPAAADQHRRRHRGRVQRPRHAPDGRQCALHHFACARHRGAGAGRNEPRSIRCGRSIRRTTSTTDRRSGGCRAQKVVRATGFEDLSFRLQAEGPFSISTATDRPRSIHARIPPFKLLDARESAFLQQRHGLGAACAHLAVTTISRLRSSSPVRCGSSPSGMSLAPAMLADLILVRLAHVEQEEVITPIDLGLQLFDGHFGYATPTAGCACADTTPQNWS